MATILVNPKHHKKARRRRRSNPAPVPNPANPARRRRRRSNPLVGSVEMVPMMANRRRKRRKNPSLAGFGVNVKDALGTAITVGVGIYGARYLTRAVLGQRDTGLVGYGATALSGVALAAAARAMGAKAETSQRLAAGALVSVLGRGVVDAAKAIGATGPLVAGGLNDYAMGATYPGSYVESGTGTRLGLPELDIDGEGYYRLRDYLEYTR